MFQSGYHDFLTWVSSIFPYSQVTLSTVWAFLGLVEFRGSTIIDCPEVLQSGTDLIVSLSVYLRAPAFKNPNLSKEEPSPKVLFNEGQETPNEQYLRERKNSLLQLFRALGLKPRRGHQSSEQDSNEGGKGLVPAPERRKGTARTEIVGDGEEIEVEDGEELSENDLNLIYKRWFYSERFMQFWCVDDLLGRKQMIGP
jgi:DNA repair protein RAD5